MAIQDQGLNAVAEGPVRGSRLFEAIVWMAPVCCLLGFGFQLADVLRHSSVFSRIPPITIVATALVFVGTGVALAGLVLQVRREKLPLRRSVLASVTLVLISWGALVRLIGELR